MKDEAYREYGIRFKVKYLVRAVGSLFIYLCFYYSFLNFWSDVTYSFLALRLQTGLYCQPGTVDACGAMLESRSNWQSTISMIVDEPATVPHYPPQILHGLPTDWTRTSRIVADPKRSKLWNCKVKITNHFKMLLGNKWDICTWIPTKNLDI
jgi:hypothetical protein